MSTAACLAGSSFPLEDEDVLVVPSRAVRHVGQLEVVQVVEDGAVGRRSVQLGRTLEEGREVLSGLRAGERVLLSESARTDEKGARS